MLEDGEAKQERTAHHEPGHVVVAAVQGLRLRPEGIMVDPSGYGLGCYCKDPNGSDLLRKRIIVAMFAGYYAEKHFCKEHSYPILEPNIWFRENQDGYDARLLIDKISTENLLNGSVFATHLELQSQSERLVEQRWAAIKSLATRLLAKKWEPLRPLESGSTWSQENESTAKYVIGQEVSAGWFAGAMIGETGSLPYLTFDPLLASN